MSYTLLALFVLTGDAYIEREHLSLFGCAGRAAMARTEYLSILPELNPKVGGIRYICLPDWKARHLVMDGLTRRLTERR